MGVDGRSGRDALGEQDENLDFSSAVPISPRALQIRFRCVEPAKHLSTRTTKICIGMCSLSRAKWLGIRLDKEALDHIQSWQAHKIRMPLLTCKRWKRTCKPWPHGNCSKSKTYGNTKMTVSSYNVPRHRRVKLLRISLSLDMRHGGGSGVLRARMMNYKGIP